MTSDWFLQEDENKIQEYKIRGSSVLFDCFCRVSIQKVLGIFITFLLRNKNYITMGKVWYDYSQTNITTRYNIVCTRESPQQSSLLSVSKSLLTINCLAF